MKFKEYLNEEELNEVAMATIITGILTTLELFDVPTGLIKAFPKILVRMSGRLIRLMSELLGDYKEDRKIDSDIKEEILKAFIKEADYIFGSADPQLYKELKFPVKYLSDMTGIDFNKIYNKYAKKNKDYKQVYNNNYSNDNEDFEEEDED